MLFQCCLQRQYSDNIGFWQRYCLFVDFLRCSFLSHLLVSRCCLNIVPMSSLETAFKHHHNSLVFFFTAVIFQRSLEKAFRDLCCLNAVAMF
jgi:hypothetical protein